MFTANTMRLVAAGAALIGGIAGAYAGPAPDWVPDPGNSRWILFGGADGVAEQQGLSVRDRASAEGTLKPATEAGQGGARFLRADGAPGFAYLLGEDWPKFKAWLGEGGEIILTLRVFDGGAGRLSVAYDSSDARVRHEPYPPGVWRRPDEWPDGVALTGSKSWKTLTVRLPFAAFTKRVHGADLRIEGMAPGLALAGVAITRVAKGQAPPLLVRQALRVAKAEGLTAAGGSACFSGSTFAQEAAEPLVMEAELATEFALQNGQTPGADPLASGGAYLHFIDGATWRFTIKTPGTYVLWERAFFPWKGGWQHMETLDGGNGTWVVDGTRTPDEGWQWIRARSYELAAGPHALSLNYHGGARLDLLVFTREDKAPDLATLKTSYRGPVVGTVWTSAVCPFDVAHWDTVRFTVAGATQFACEFSTDDGTTWHTFDPAKGLADVAVKGGGADQIQFRLQLEGTPGQAPPAFLGGMLTYQAGPANVKVIEDAALRLEVDPYGVRAIHDKRRNLTVAKAIDAHPALAELSVKKPGDAPVTTLDLYGAALEKVETSGTAERPALALHYRFDNGLRLILRADLLGNGQCEWRATVENQTELEVVGLAFPILSGCALGGDATDDWAFLAKCWGQVWQNPGSAGRIRTEWGPAMRWSALWDTKQGLYLGIEDERHDDYAFLTGGDGGGAAVLGARQQILARPHTSWTSATYRLAVTGPDWHEGADLYKAYLARTLKPCGVPPYVKWLVDAWTTQDSNAASTIGWDMIQPTELALMAANRQMLDGADSGYCGLYPYPCLAWGSVREFAQKLAVRRALGGFYTPYHNFRLWSPGYGHYPRIGVFPRTELPADVPKPDDAWYRKVAAYGFTGNYSAVETDYYAQEGTAMASREWRDWLAYWTKRYLEWGTDGMYYDQYNMLYGNGRLYPDFETYGNWVPAILSISERLQAESVAVNRYYTSSGEFVNDLYGQYVNLHMTSGVMNRLEFFRYCNPTQLLIDGGWNGGLNPVFGPNRHFFIWQVGARFEQPPADARILALRRAVKSLLYDAEFRDTVGLTVRDAAGKPIEPIYTALGQGQNAPTQGTIARWFRVRQGSAHGAIVNLINSPVRRDATVTLDTSAFGPVRAAWAWTLEGDVVPVRGTQKGNAYSFPVPASELASVVLSAGLPPVVEWQFDPAMTRGEPNALRLKLTNVNAEPLTGTAELRLPKRFSGPPRLAFGPLAPGESLAFPLQVTAEAKAADGRHDFWCELRTPAGTFSAYQYAVVNPPVVADFRGSPGTYHVWVKNLSATAFSGTVAVRAPAGLEASCAAEFALPPRTEIAVPVTVRGQAALKRIAELAATVRVGKQTIEVVRAVIPAAPNGDFEADGAGDQKPDWWMCRKLGDEWSYEALHLDPAAHSGRWCLRLDPVKGADKFYCAYPVHSVLAPNRRYRVSVWIRAASPDGVYVSVPGGNLGKGKTGPEWKQFSCEFTTGGGLPCFSRVLFNFSDQPAYFDDLTVEELGDVGSGAK